VKKRSLFNLLLSLIFLGGHGVKAYSSLFFTEEEVRERQTPQERFLTHEQLSLSGILYLGENHWTVWINGTIIRPDTVSKLKGFHITKVTPYEVEISRMTQDQRLAETIILRPLHSL